MFFLMMYQTVVASTREINLARQFSRVSLVHRMETILARQPFRISRLPPAFISSLVFYLRGVALQGKRIFDGQRRAATESLRPKTPALSPPRLEP